MSDLVAENARLRAILAAAGLTVDETGDLPLINFTYECDGRKGCGYFHADSIEHAEHILTNWRGHTVEGMMLWMESENAPKRMN